MLWWIPSGFPMCKSLLVGQALGDVEFLDMSPPVDGGGPPVSTPIGTAASPVLSCPGTGRPPPPFPRSLGNRGFDRGALAAGLTLGGGVPVPRSGYRRPPVVTRRLTPSRGVGRSARMTSDPTPSLVPATAVLSIAESATLTGLCLDTIKGDNAAGRYPGAR